MQETVDVPLTAREVAGDILRYMTIKGVTIEKMQEAMKMITDEFEEE